MKKILTPNNPNGIKSEFTAEELAINEQTKQEVENRLQQQEQVRQEAITKKTSAKSKLLALGLTEEEIKLTFGI
jgi:hypothetical protein